MVKYFLVGAGCLAAGFFIGFFVANNLNRSAGLQMNAAGGPPFFNQQQPAASVKEPNAAMLPDVTETLDRAKNAPNDFEAQMKAGDMYQKIQNFEKAGGFYDAAAALKPTDYLQIVRLANAFFDIRQFEKAEPLYLKALEKNPNDIAVRTDLGITFLERAAPDYDRAIREFEASVKLDPKHEPTLYNLAAAHFRKGNAESAQKYLGDLEKANPNSLLVGRLKQILGQQ